MKETRKVDLGFWRFTLKLKESGSFSFWTEQNGNNEQSSKQICEQFFIMD
jgi:hypothetical protein